ncbi:peptidyl-prolyl cis-trans isomerase [Pseudoscourfieldia marina]
MGSAMRARATHPRGLLLANNSPRALKAIRTPPSCAANCGGLPRWANTKRLATKTRASGEGSAANEDDDEPSLEQLVLEQQQQKTQKKTARRKADSTDAIATFLTRRFGIAGGIAWLGVLTFGVVSEQLKTRRENFLEKTGTVDVSDAEEVALDSGVKYKDLRLGGGVGNAGQPRYPERGDIISGKVSVWLADGAGSGTDAKGTFVDDNGGKLVAFLFARRPLRGALTEGLEAAVASMRAGGRRRVFVPASLAFGNNGAAFPSGGIVPGGADVVYEIEVERISVPPS